MDSFIKCVPYYDKGDEYSEVKTELTSYLLSSLYYYEFVNIFSS